MIIQEWEQLAERSIEHSCLDDGQRNQAMEVFARDWEVFCELVVNEYGEYASTLSNDVR